MNTNKQGAINLMLAVFATCGKPAVQAVAAPSPGITYSPLKPIVPGIGKLFGATDAGTAEAAVTQWAFSEHPFTNIQPPQVIHTTIHEASHQQCLMAGGSPGACKQQDWMADMNANAAVSMWNTFDECECVACQ